MTLRPCSTVPRRKFGLGTVLHGPEERIFPRTMLHFSMENICPQDRGALREHFLSGPCTMVPLRINVINTVLHGPKEKNYPWDCAPSSLGENLP